MPEAQKNKIIKLMKRGIRVNKLTAFRFTGCMTLAQRIKDIEEDIKLGKLPGWKLTRKVDPKHHCAMEYWLEKEHK